MDDVLKIYVVWSPRFTAGANYARHIVRQFDSLGMVRERKRIGVPVRVRCAPLNGAAPRKIDFNEAETSLVIYLSDADLVREVAEGGPWAAFHDHICDAALQEGGTVHALTVGMTRNGLGLRRLGRLEAIRFYEEKPKLQQTDLADGSPNEPTRRLLITLVNHAGSIMRAQSRRRRGEPEDQPIKVFLSHTHSTGRSLALAVRDRIASLKTQRAGTDVFLDSDSLRNGRDFQEQFEEAIQDGVLLVIHTDDYATRRFCRWEMLCAKRHHRPIVITQWLQNGESRTFPYSGNTPLTVFPQPETPAARNKLLERLLGSGEANPATAGGDGEPTSLADSPQTRRVVDNLLIAVMSETLRFETFSRDVERVAEQTGVKPAAILARPPELADLAQMHRQRRQDVGPGDTQPPQQGPLVYPDPPLDDDEIALVDELSEPFVATTLSELKIGGGSGKRPEELRRKSLENRLIGIASANVAEAELAALGFQTDLEAAQGERSNSISALWQALAEFVTVAAQLGARLAYGGDLRAGGLTRRLFDELSDAYYTLELKRGTDRFINYLAHSVWRGETGPGRFKLSPQDLFEHINSMETLGGVRLFLENGEQLHAAADGAVVIRALPGASNEAMALDNRIESAGGMERFYQNVPPPQGNAGASLTAMRQAMAAEEDARVLVGGSLQGSGKYPGVLEEAYETIRAGKLTLPLAAFGGAAHDAADALDLLPNGPLIERTAVERDQRHQGYDEIMSLLRGQREEYRKILNAHNVGLEKVKQLAASDSPHGVAERARGVFSGVSWPKATVEGT